MVVITGDNKLTAEAICRQIGVFRPDDDLSGRSLTGRAFAELPLTERRAILKVCTCARSVLRAALCVHAVYAAVSPRSLLVMLHIRASVWIALGPSRANWGLMTNSMGCPAWFVISSYSPVAAGLDGAA